MNLSRSFLILSGAIITAAVMHNRRPAAPPPDLRDAVIDIPAASTPAVPNPDKFPARPGERTANEPDWAPISGGKFLMGAASKEAGLDNALPQREVSVTTFEISLTPVTVAQYALCVDAEACPEPVPNSFHNCNWLVPGRQDHPMNCVSWNEASDYARFIGARLPTEAEWEYAARSGGRQQLYPWGDTPPSCDRVVMSEAGKEGCGTGSTMPVCSKPDGNTAQGLCDMAGNVYEWTQDSYLGSYAGAPIDGSAYTGTSEQQAASGYKKVARGGSFSRPEPFNFRVESRTGFPLRAMGGGLGFRVARDKRQ